MLRLPSAALLAALSLGMPGPAIAGDIAGITPESVYRAQGALLGLGVVNDKIALGASHLLCREAAVVATNPKTPGSASRQSARVLYGNLGARLDSQAAQANALLIDGLREAGLEASPETIAALEDRAQKGLSSRLFQVNPATAGDMAASCKALLAGSFSQLPTAVAAR